MDRYPLDFSNSGKPLPVPGLKGKEGKEAYWSPVDLELWRRESLAGFVVGEG